jgi:predicted nucleic acid-binding protein
MQSDFHHLVFVDASTLINFLRIDRLDLLTECWTKLSIVEEVLSEIVDSDQLAILQKALDAESINIYRVTDLNDIELGTTLYDKHGLGRGEAFSFVAAKREKATLAIDDGRAIKQASRHVPGVPILKTPDMVVRAIRLSRLTISEADAIKSEWAVKYRFRLAFESFSELC